MHLSVENPQTISSTINTYDHESDIGEINRGGIEKAIRRPNSGGLYLEGMTSNHTLSTQKLKESSKNQAYRMYIDQNLKIL